MTTIKKVSQVVVKVPCPDRVIEVRVTPPDSQLDVRILNEGDSLELKILPRGRQIEVKVNPIEETDDIIKEPLRPKEATPLAEKASESIPPVTGKTFLGVEVTEVKEEDLNALDAPDLSFTETPQEEFLDNPSASKSGPLSAVVENVPESVKLYEKGSSFPLMQAPLAVPEPANLEAQEVYEESSDDVSALSSHAPHDEYQEEDYQGVEEESPGDGSELGTDDYQDSPNDAISDDPTDASLVETVTPAEGALHGLGTDSTLEPLTDTAKDAPLDNTSDVVSPEEASLEEASFEIAPDETNKHDPIDIDESTLKEANDLLAKIGAPPMDTGSPPANPVDSDIAPENSLIGHLDDTPGSPMDLDEDTIREANALLAKIGAPPVGLSSQDPKEGEAVEDKAQAPASEISPGAPMDLDEDTIREANALLANIGEPPVDLSSQDPKEGETVEDKAQAPASELSPGAPMDLDEDTIREANALLANIGEPPVDAGSLGGAQGAALKDEESTEAEDSAPRESVPYDLDEDTIREANLLLEKIGQPPMDTGSLADTLKSLAAPAAGAGLAAGLAAGLVGDAPQGEDAPENSNPPEPTKDTSQDSSPLDASATLDASTDEPKEPVKESDKSDADYLKDDTHHDMEELSSKHEDAIKDTDGDAESLKDLAESTQLKDDVTGLEDNPSSEGEEEGKEPSKGALAADEHSPSQEELDEANKLLELAGKPPLDPESIHTEEELGKLLEESIPDSQIDVEEVEESDDGGGESFLDLMEKAREHDKQEEESLGPDKSTSAEDPVAAAMMGLARQEERNAREAASKEAKARKAEDQEAKSEEAEDEEDINEEAEEEEAVNEEATSEEREIQEAVDAESEPLEEAPLDEPPTEEALEGEKASNERLTVDELDGETASLTGDDLSDNAAAFSVEKSSQGDDGPEEDHRSNEEKSQDPGDPVDDGAAKEDDAPFAPEDDGEKQPSPWSLVSSAKVTDAEDMASNLVEPLATGPEESDALQDELDQGAKPESIPESPLSFKLESIQQDEAPKETESPSDSLDLPDSMESIEAQHEEVVASPPQEPEESVPSPQFQVESAAKTSIPEAEDKILEGTLDRASSLVDEDSASADLFLDNEAAQQEESPVAPFKLESESVDMIPEGEKETPESPEDESLADDPSPPDEEHKSAPIIPDVLSIEAQTPVKDGDPNFIEGLKLENSEEAKAIAPESVASEKLSPEPLEAEEVLPKEVLSEPQKDLLGEPSEENAHDEVKATEGQKVPPKEEPKNPEFTDTSMSDISLEGLSLDNLSLDSDPLQSDFSPDSSIAKLPPEADVQIDPGDELKLVSSGSGLMDEPPLELNDKVNPGESRVPDGAPDIKLARREPQESDYLEANSDYVGADAGSVVDPRSQVEEKAPFERFDGKAGLESPYAGTRPAGKPRAESSTAVIVNYLDDKEETPMVEEGEYGALGAEEDLDLDLLELNNPPSFKAKPMIPVPRAPR